MVLLTLKYDSGPMASLLIKELIKKDEKRGTGKPIFG
jgi:hypothetical protein